MSSRESVGKTFLVAGILCVVCSVLVSVAAVGLRPIQQKNKLLDKKRNILAAAGLMSEGADVEVIFKEKIKIRAVDLNTGDYNESIDAATYDQRKAAKDPEQSIQLTAEEDKPRIKRIAKTALVYEVVDGSGALQQVILPVHGKGLWSTLYGFLAVEANTKTVVGLGFYEHAETPGLGGEVDNPKWKASWEGKELFNEQWDVAMTVLKGKVVEGNPNAIHQVDGLSGATLTTVGVSDLVRFWIGPKGFAKYLSKVRERGNTNG